MELKYKNILYCTDFSDDADYAFLTALDMAEKYQAHLVVFHVLHSPYKYSRQVVDEQSEGGEEAFLSPELLDKGVQKLKEKYGPKLGGFQDYEYQVVGGVPFVEIVRFARAHNVDFIVLGASGSSELGQDDLRKHGGKRGPPGPLHGDGHPLPRQNFQPLIR